MSDNIDQAKKQADSRDIKVRVVENSDGPVVEQLAKHGGFTMPGIDWNDISPYWLIAEINGEIVGCIQVCIGKPIGRLEIMCTKPGLSHIQKALVIKNLLLIGCETLKQSGSQFACGIIPFQAKSYKRILKSHGCVTITSGNMMVKALYGI